MGDDTPEERQTNELIVLKSIYGEAVVEVGNEEESWSEGEAEGAGQDGGWRPLHVALTLLPLHDSAGAHCALTLAFKCCHQYPDKPPKISVRSVRGLSLENMNKLLQELEQMAAGLSGEVMIYQLASHTQQFLHEHNKPVLSFYEQMMREKTQLEETRRRNLQQREHEEARQMRAALLQRQETLLAAAEPAAQEAGDRPDLRLLCYEERANVDWGTASDVEGAAVVCGDCACAGRGLHPVRFDATNTKMFLGHCLGHSRLGSAHLALEAGGAPALVRRWQLPAAGEVRRRERQLAALQREAAAVRAVRCGSLEAYGAVQVQSGARTQLFAARRLLAGGSLRRFTAAARLYLGAADSLRLVRRVARALLAALAALHEAGLLHRDVRASNLYLDPDGEVRLVGAAVDGRLLELMRGDDSCDKHSSALDVQCAGGVLLALAGAAGPGALPARLPLDARDFFARCAAQDERSLWPAARLAAHGFLQPGPPRAPHDPCSPTGSPPPHAQKGETEAEDREEAEERGEGPSEAGGELLTPGEFAGGASRLSLDFEVLSWIGKGGFGDVVKVRNKLDRGVYAIKRIQLNPRDAALNRKVMREVKLLSRLSHEHVVRYYNAWVEASAAPRAGRPPAPPRLQWSLSGAPAAPRRRTRSRPDTDTDSDSDSDSNAESDSDSDTDERGDGPGAWSLSTEEDTSGIVFQAEDEECGGGGERMGSEDVQHVLYIQMEFCEKHTLRQAIDGGLHEEPVRAWRLFREVLEGLAHVHARGMIHRDLKPANIFLDSDDRVKIGDFGLATNMLSRLSAEDKTKSHEEGDSALTGEVGTAMYVAPELTTGAGGAAGAGGYNQKADVYSLGVTLFEMFHAPFATGAERAAVLGRLRRPEVVLPPDFDTPANAKQVYLLRWMLRAEPAERPTCAQLAASQHVPRAVPRGALAALLEHALAERGSPAHAQLVRACLAQRAQPADELLFHEPARAHRGPPPAAHSAHLQHLADAVVEVFRSHGAHELTPPLLTLRGDAWDTRADAVRLMTAAGAVCLLPYDLRLPFARLVASGGVQRVRRYAVGRVFRERSARGYHPREALECAFDIVEPPTESLWADAEVLACAARCAQALGLRVARLRLGHAELLGALLRCAGLPAERAAPLVGALRDFALGRLVRQQLQTHLATLALGGRHVAMLLRLADAELPVSELPDLLAQVQRGQSGAVLQRAAHHLALLHHRARALGCELPMTVVPLLAYGAEQHSGVFWQLVAGEPSQRLRERHVVAAGGRYDELVQRLGRAACAAGRGREPAAAVGFSLSLERAAALSQNPAQGRAGAGAEGAAPVLVEAAGGAALARELWARGLRCALWEGEEHEARALPSGLLLRPLGDTVRVDLWEGSKAREMVLAPGDAVELVRRQQAPDGAAREAAGASGAAGAGGGEGERGGAPSVLVAFVTGDEKLNRSYRRQIENQVAASVTARVAAAGAARRVAVVALAAEEARVAAVAARLPAPAPPPSAAAPLLLQALADIFAKRADLLEEAQTEVGRLARAAGGAGGAEAALLALYSIPDGSCRLLL